MTLIIVNLAVAGVLVSAPLNYPKDIVKCPDTLSVWMKNTLTYQTEGKVAWEDDWKTPKRTIEEEGGDCEDFAFLVRAVLKELKYEYAKVLHFYSKTKKRTISHAICVYKTKDNTFKYFSNQYLKGGEFKTLDQLLKSENPEWQWVRQLQIPYKRSKKTYRKGD